MRPQPKKGQTTHCSTRWARGRRQACHVSTRTTYSGCALHGYPNTRAAPARWQGRHATSPTRSFRRGSHFFTPPFAALTPSTRRWSPNPLLAAQMLSIIPASRDQLVVDLFADPDHRTTRPVPPPNPWRVCWSGPNRLLFLMPPTHLASPAVAKFLSENAAGVIALTDEVFPATHQAAAAAAHFTLRFPRHQDNCLSFADGPPMHPSSITAYAFFCNKQPTSTSVVAPLHPSWRELLPPPVNLDHTRHLALPPAVAPGQIPS